MKPCLQQLSPARKLTMQERAEIRRSVHKAWLEHKQWLKHRERGPDSVAVPAGREGGGRSRLGATPPEKSS